MKETKKSETYQELLELAREYGVDNNALFVNAAKQYATQLKVIKMIEDGIENLTSLTSMKSTVYKGEPGESVSPLIKELPKHSEVANKTATVLLNIINTLGAKQSAGSKLDAFLQDK